MQRYTILALALCSAVSFMLGTAVPDALSPASPAARGPVPGGAGAVNFADVADRVNPAVVNIEAATRMGAERRRRGFDERSDSPRELEVPHQGSGSGFVINRQG